MAELTPEQIRDKAIADAEAAYSARVSVAKGIYDTEVGAATTERQQARNAAEAAYQAATTSQVTALDVLKADTTLVELYNVAPADIDAYVVTKSASVLEQKQLKAIWGLMQIARPN